VIAGGINNIPFHNVALGQLEICKNMITDLGSLRPQDSFGQSFTFNYVNTSDKSIKGTVKVAAGACSLPQVVAAGNYTVTEDLTKNQVQLGGSMGPKVNAFQFVASDARGPLGDNRCVPPQATAPNTDVPLVGTTINTNCGNPLTVSVPYFASSDPVKFGETQVTFWNKQVRGSIKICKQITSDSTASLGNTTFDFTWSVQGDGSGTAHLKPGTCTGNLGNFAIAQAGNNGGLAPVLATVTETAPTLIAHVNSVTLTGGQALSGFGTGSGTNGLNGTIPYAVTFNPGPGVNVVTYTNQANPART